MLGLPSIVCLTKVSRFTRLFLSIFIKYLVGIAMNGGDRRRRRNDVPQTRFKRCRLSLRLRGDPADTAAGVAQDPRRDRSLSQWLLRPACRGHPSQPLRAALCVVRSEHRVRRRYNCCWPVFWLTPSSRHPEPGGERERIGCHHALQRAVAPDPRPMRA